MKQSAIKHGLPKEKLKNGSINDEGKDETPMVVIKINESRYIASFLVSGSSKYFFSNANIYLNIDNANIYLFSIFFSIDFSRWKSMGLHYIACIVIQ